MRHFINIIEQQFLIELADNPYKYQLNIEDDDEIEYSFKTPEAQFIIEFRIDHNDIMHIEFSRISITRSWGVTGTGDQFKIFSTILKIMQEVINKRNPTYVLFESDRNETSRIKLYQMFAKNFSKYFPNYIHDNDSGKNVNFHKFFFIHRSA